MRNSDNLAGHCLASFFNLFEQAQADNRPLGERLALLDQAEGELTLLAQYVEALGADLNLMRARLVGAEGTA